MPKTSLKLATGGMYAVILVANLDNDDIVIL